MASKKKVLKNVEFIIEQAKAFYDNTGNSVEVFSDKVIFSKKYFIEFIKITPQERTLLIKMLEHEK